MEDEFTASPIYTKGLLRAHSEFIRSLCTAVCKVIGTTGERVTENWRDVCMKAVLAITQAVGRQRWSEVAPLWDLLVRTKEFDVRPQIKNQRAFFFLSSFKKICHISTRTLTRAFTTKKQFCSNYLIVEMDLL